MADEAAAVVRPTFGRVAILAGGGELPRAIAARCAASGTDVHIVAIEGAAEEPLTALYPHTWVNLGQAHRMFSALRGPADAPKPNVMVIAGAVRRPDILKLRPDRGTLPLLAEFIRLITAGGDDALLTRAIRIFERQGLTVVGVDAVAPDLILQAGTFGTIVPDATAEADIARAADVIAELGNLDVGQAVVVASGRVRAIEGAEGTDQMLARLAASGGTQRAVLLKSPKPGQERRVDLPTIGPLTVAAAIPAGICGIAVVAGSSIGLQREAMIASANAAQMFLVGRPMSQVQPLPDIAAEAATLQIHGRRRPRASDMLDVRRGLTVVARLAPFATGQAAVVVRGHVLAVSAAEPLRHAVERAHKQGQWGINRFPRRRGALAVRIDAQADWIALLTMASAAADTGLAGLAVAFSPAVRDLDRTPLIERAASLNLFLVEAVSPSRP